MCVGTFHVQNFVLFILASAEYRLQISQFAARHNMITKDPMNHRCVVEFVSNCHLFWILRSPRSRRQELELQPLTMSRNNGDQDDQLAEHKDK